MAPGFLVLKVYIYSFKQYRMADFGTPSKNKMLRPMIICLLGLVVAHLSTAQRRGETGKTGVPGDDGVAGRPGKDGETGATGATGQFGGPGRTGGTGATGPMGIPGATGYSAQRAGPTGATGEQGPPGQPGLPGPSAVLGRSTRVNQRAKGPQGPPGRVGPTGLPGAQGPPGTPGTIPDIDCSLYGPRRLQMEEEKESFIKGLVNSYTLATASIALCVVSLEILLGTFVYTSSKSRQLWKRLYLLQTR